jgi:SurA-like N-terminal domain
MTAARRPRLLLAAASVAAVAILVSACSNQQPGAAATLGDTRISEQTLSAEVQAVLVAKGQPATSVDEALPPDMLGRLITIELVDQLAAREGVVVTQGQIDEQLANYEGQAGDRAAVEKVFIEQGVAPSQIESIVKLNTQAQELGIKLAPNGSAEEQRQAVVDAVVALSEELDTTVSPRFGTWDAATISVGPAPDDLSAPPAVG